MGLVGLVAAGASVLMVWLLLEHGTSGVAGMCDVGETNYIDTVITKRVELVYRLEYKQVKTETCFAWIIWCRDTYRRQGYYVQVNQTKLERTFETRCCPGHSRENASVPCVQMGCLNGNYGENCTEACSCPANAHQNCDQETGQCMCLPGWNGTNCTEGCENGYYGTNCHSACECNNNATCDSKTGDCNCTAGWEGHFCQSACSNNTYGDACNNTCRCNDTQICNHVTGECDTCIPGVLPPDCKEVCPRWMYGQNCSYNCTCETAHTRQCDFRNGECLCNPGYNGSECQSVCPLGTYGLECNVTCDACADGYCDNVNGTCYECYGKQGDNCSQECDDGTFGFDCLSACPCINSHSNGSCDPCNGACHCLVGWTGYDCNTKCPVTMTDEQCQNMDFVGACEPWNSTWSCRDGWTGNYCTEVCPSGRYGKNCSSVCACTTSHDCDPVTGDCTCKAERTADKCGAACEEGRYGSNCSLNCSCSSRQDCNPVTGNCTCKRGWTGDQCDKACPPGKYGFMCSSNCTCDEGKYGCHPVNGSCDCEKGWDGDHCMAALGSSQGEGTMFDESLTYYIVAAAGGFLAIVFAVSIIVFLKRRSIGKQGKPSLSANTHETEMPNKEPVNADDTIDSQQKQVPSTEETDTSIAMQPDDDVCETECSRDKDDDEDEHDYDETNDAVVDIDETVPAAETAEETFPDDEEHYVDVENESSAASKPLRSEIVQIDDEHNDDYDTYDVCVSNNSKKEAPKPDDSYDKFENVQKSPGSQDQDDDYDVLARDEPRRMMSTEDYSTFESVRKESLRERRKSEDDGKRESECYEKLDYLDEKEHGLKFDTSMYNMGNELPIIKGPANIQNQRANNDTHISTVKPDDVARESDNSLPIASKDENRLSERLYEDCIEEESSGQKEPGDISTTTDQEEIYEQVSENSDDERLGSVHSQADIGMEIYEQVPENSDDEHVDSVHSKADIDMEIYENLGHLSEEPDSKQVPVPEPEPESERNEECPSDKKVLKSKERKAVDYETFELKFR